MIDGTIVLGRDGMGEGADEDDFEAWIHFVGNRIDAATGLDIVVEMRGKGDVQDTAYRGFDDPQPVRDAVQSLWDAFCSDPMAWPVRS